MTTAHSVTANLRCGGCESTIRKKLSAIPGVEKVNFDLETSTTSVELNESEKREELTKVLFSLEYPEAIEKKGLLTQRKSFGSCLSSKLSN